MANTRSVLIAEDSEFISDILQDIFREMGFKIAGVVTSGEEVVRMYERMKPDLISMDILMPGMDGLTAMEKIREMDKDVPIIVISALMQNRLKARAKELGAVDFIEKPFNIDDVEAAVEKIGLL